ncbi:MAG: hypothetical protein EZS28_035974, partial [Streblomastix strix]
MFGRIRVIELMSVNKYILYLQLCVIWTLNKILFVFVFSAISLCEARKHDPIFSFFKKKPNEDDRILNFGFGSINDNRELMWNYTNRDPDYLFDDDEVPFEYREPYRPGTKITDKSFLIIPNISKADFEKLNTSKPLNELENACLPVYQAYRSYYTILGYTILALKGVDIQPSITYIMMNYPTKEIQKYPDGTMYEDSEIDIEQPVCESYSVGNNNAIPYVVHKYGVVGTDCFPNTAVPGSTTECSQKDGKFEKYLVGYKQGIFQGDADVMKEALIKFGPVYVYGSHEIFIGWD